VLVKHASSYIKIYVHVLVVLSVGIPLVYYIDINYVYMP